MTALCWIHNPVSYDDPAHHFVLEVVDLDPLILLWQFALRFIQYC